VYSRKHGDLERDYNFFVSLPEYYSQGNGNFRDVLQNRRNDVLIDNRVKDFNIFFFGNLIQADGYNPLEISGTKFSLKPNINFDELLKDHQLSDKKLESLLKNEFTPGEVVQALLSTYKVSLEDTESILEQIIENSSQKIVAEFGEGYWQDHFTYFLDLIENYLSIYPDKLKEMLFERNDYKYYSSKAFVLPRNDKLVLNKQSKVRQYNAIIHDDEKIKKCGLKPGSNWFVDDQGKIVYTNLFGKLFTLIINKYAALDPDGIGISYEANKPGWNDAMNGLPGLIGSGVGETIELYRLVDFIIKGSKNYLDETVNLFEDLIYFANKLKEDSKLSLLKSWNYRFSLLEDYRKKTRFENVKSKVVRVGDFIETLDLIKDKLLLGLDKALEIGNGIFPTYLVYEATKYNQILVDDNIKKTNGLENVEVLEFKCHSLPYFLEAPARSLKLNLPNLNKKELYNSVLKTELYDDELKFYKTSIDLSGLNLEVGRIVAFSKGWFERESNFLHMTYKYIYGLLKAGLYDEFYNEIKTNLVCFMNPNVYGRSTLENSSFIVPSNNPDKRLWGQGFVARLSGSTAEVLSMWYFMFFGKSLFTYDKNELSFSLSPKLSASFFNDEGIVSAKLFKNIEVTYHNHKRLNTYDKDVIISKMECFSNNDEFIVYGNKTDSKTAEMIRNGDIIKINVTIDKL
jgi:hypothetical protein